MTSPLSQKAREYAEGECSTAGTWHLRSYVALHYEAGYRAALEKLSERERETLAQQVALLHRESPREIVDALYSTLLKLRGLS